MTGNSVEIEPQEEYVGNLNYSIPSDTGN